MEHFGHVSLPEDGEEECRPVVRREEWRWKTAVDWSLSSLNPETMSSILCRVCLPGVQHLPKKQTDQKMIAAVKQKARLRMDDLQNRTCLPFWDRQSRIESRICISFVAFLLYKMTQADVYIPRHLLTQSISKYLAENSNKYWFSDDQWTAVHWWLRAALLKSSRVSTE